MWLQLTAVYKTRRFREVWLRVRSSKFLHFLTVMEWRPVEVVSYLVRCWDRFCEGKTGLCFQLPNESKNSSDLETFFSDATTHQLLM